MDGDGFYCKIILDSIAPCGKRLTTIEARYPRFIHSEIMTHRDRARNAASSRAIPWPKMLAAITEDPVVPIKWGAEQKGMQTGDEIGNTELARSIWLKARDNAVASAQALADLGVHKSICNRITEPWMWITVVMTATEWANFFRLRCHPDAEIHFQRIAGLIRDQLESSKPREVNEGGWHMPYVTGIDERDLRDGMIAADYDYESIEENLRDISVARCARVSYLTHSGKRDPQEDLAMFDRLTTGSGFGHWSPMEHVACASEECVRSGPFIGWHQYRKEFANENLPG